MIDSQKNFKEKWNLKVINDITIARLLSEIEGVYYILDSIDEKDAEIIDSLRKKYYKIYFQMKRSY